MTKQLREIISEDATFVEDNTWAQATLHPNKGSFDGVEASDVEKALEIFRNMNADQRARHVDYLQKTLETSAWRKPGAGVPSDYATKNKKDHEGHKFTKEELDSVLDDFGFTPEAKRRGAELFYEAVEKHSSFRTALREYVASYFPSPFLSADKIDVMETLANCINELEKQIYHIEHDTEQLRQDLKEKITQGHGKNLDENTVNFAWKTSDDFDQFVYQLDHFSKSERAPKKSTVAEMLEYVDPDNPMTEEERRYTDPAMRSYLKALGEDV